MKALLALLALCSGSVCQASPLLGEDPAKREESLPALVRNSTLIVVADIVNPALYGSVDEFVVSYTARIHIRQTLFGRTSEPEVWIRIFSRPFDASKPECLFSPQRCLFFLRRDDANPNNSNSYMGAVHLTSVQPYAQELDTKVRSLIGVK